MPLFHLRLPSYTSGDKKNNMFNNPSTRQEITLISSHSKSALRLTWSLDVLFGNANFIH